MHQLIPGNILWQSVQQSSGLVFDTLCAYATEYSIQDTTGQLMPGAYTAHNGFTLSSYSIKWDREDNLQLLLARAVVRNCSFLSENVFILSITSSLVSLARGGRFIFG
jgi:hypothetical protein